MDSVLQSLLSGAPVLLTHLAAAFALFGLAASLYMAITPMKEMTLIRAGNTAAAVSLAGGLLGIALPLAACLAASVSILDLVVWGVPCGWWMPSSATCAAGSRRGRRRQP